MRSVGVAVLMCVGNASPASAEWTFGAFLGAARTEATSITLRQPSASTEIVLSPVHYRSESLKPPLYYAYRVGFFPRSGWLGIEGEFIHLKVIADTARPARFSGIFRGEPAGGRRPISSVVERFSITHGLNLLLVNAVARRRADLDERGTPRWILAARIGAGASVPHAESTIRGRTLELYEWGSFSIQAAASVEIRLAKPLYLSGEYKLTHTVQDVTVVDGSARTPLTSHHVVAGVVVHLGVRRLD